MSKKKDDPPELAAALYARMEQAPYRTLGIAVGLGLVVGGGMWRLLARSLLGIGARTLVAAIESNHQEA